MVYDGDCRFCTLWVRRWKQCTGLEVEYLPSQSPQIRNRFPELPNTIFDEAVQLIETDGRVFSGAEAVFRSLSHSGVGSCALPIYQRHPLFAQGTEALYKIVARHRPFFSFLTRIGWGDTVEAPSYVAVRRLFLPLLGIIYFIAFVSLWTQITGLIGHDGILPVNKTMDLLRTMSAQREWGANRLHLFPTFCWMNDSNAFLHLQCGAGVVFAFLLMIGVAPLLSLIILWALYLSLSTVGLDFLSFQWDTLLLETGFLAIFFAPRQLLLRSNVRPPSTLSIWLLRWLLFRFMFESGIVKLLSGDPNWKNLTALRYHYETQPLPTVFAWYANQLPLWWHKGSTALMFIIELLLPFFVFLPRRPRILAAIGFVALQIGIAITGNYGFLNLLTAVLSMVLLDDATLRRFFPRLANYPKVTETLSRREPSSMMRPILAGFGAAAIIALTSAQLLGLFYHRIVGPAPLITLQQWVEPLRTFNRYGLFAVMTTSRPEITVEGSNDGTNWLPYEFKYKVNDPKQRPSWVAPHQPRLDWQMWFAALGSLEENRWFENFCNRLLEGSPSVLNLLKSNPFPEKPPQFIRAILYNYRFTSREQRRAQGDWWTAEKLQLYYPPTRLKASVKLEPQNR